MKLSKIINLNLKMKKFQHESYSSIINITSESIYHEYEKLYQKFKDNKLRSNTTVYLTPLSSFPSYKLKNYIEENKLNIKTARKIEKLDTLVINDSFIREAYFSNIQKEKAKKYYEIPYDVIAKDFSSFINKDDNYGNILRMSQYNLTKKQKQKGISKPESFIMSEENINSAIKQNKVFIKLLDFPSTTGELLVSTHGNKSACDNVEFLHKLFDLVEKNNLDVVFDNNINSEVNKEISIDLEMFDTLYGMLASTDKSNWVIAREIIANCDFESSKPYVLFLSNIFNFLKIKGDNKNYHLIHKQIREIDKKSPYHFLDKHAQYDKFIQAIVGKFPEYKQHMCDCLTTHLNHLFKTSIIKSIHSL